MTGCHSVPSVGSNTHCDAGPEGRSEATEGVDDTNVNRKLSTPSPPAGYSPLSQGESQLLPTKWPHRQYIILPALQGGTRGRVLGQAMPVWYAKTRWHHESDAIFIYCMHLQRGLQFYSSTVSFCPFPLCTFMFIIADYLNY